MPRAATTSAGNEAVESVTRATDMRRGYRPVAASPRQEGGKRRRRGSCHTHHRGGPVSVTTTPAIDTSAMNTVHTLFRRELRLAAGLVRGVAERDHPRATVVGRHLDLVERTLHHHHTAEDELLWPRLLERVPSEIAPLVELMEAQHGTVDSLLGRIGPLRTTWQRTTEGGEELAALYEQLYDALHEHLTAEEQQVLPLVGRCLTQAEWDELGEAGRKG